MNEERRQELLAEFEALGEAKVRHLRAINHWASDHYRNLVSQEWLIAKDVEREARASARAEEALASARLANKIAASAMILSAIATYIAYRALTN